MATNRGKLMSSMPRMGNSTGFAFTLAGVIKLQNRKWWTTAYGGRDE